MLVSYFLWERSKTEESLRLQHKAPQPMIFAICLRHFPDWASEQWACPPPPYWPGREGVQLQYSHQGLVSRAKARGVLEPAHASFLELIMHTSSQFGIQWPHTDSLKSAMVALFTLRELRNTKFLFLESLLLNIYQHTTRWSPESCGAC